MAAPAPAWHVETYEGAVILRSPWAAEPQPAEWRQLLAGALRDMPGVVAVGAKRLAGDGSVFSMGELVIHPKGFHHLGKGVPGEAYRFPEEVELIAGGVLAVQPAALAVALARMSGAEREGVPAPSTVLSDLPHYLRDELAPLHLGLALRQVGGRCVALPQVVVADAHTPEPDAGQTRAFAQFWGFDWRAADLAAVQARYAGTGLLWNVRYHAAALPFEKYRQRPATHWDNYANVAPYRQRADHLARLVRELAPAPGPAPAPAPGFGAAVLDVGCGDGLFAHLFAQGGARVTGVDPEPLAIAQATQRTAPQTYPAGPPRFVTGRGDALPAGDAAFDLVALFDVIEHLPNPVAVLREVQRVLRPAGHLLLTTPAWQFGGSSDAVYHVCEYTAEELLRQLTAATSLRVVHTGRITGVYRDLVVAARK